jgi:hypothetical protein
MSWITPLWRPSDPHPKIVIRVTFFADPPRIMFQAVKLDNVIAEQPSVISQ